MIPPGYAFRSCPTVGQLRLHPFRVALVRYSRLGQHRLATACIRACMIAWRAWREPSEW